MVIKREVFKVVVVLNDGSQILKVSIVIFKKTNIEVWREGDEQPSIIPITKVSTIA